jgi:hypothetical protein
MKNKLITCQECGQKLNSWADKHTLEDCGKYHLKRAEQILGFSYINLDNVRKEKVALEAAIKIRFAVMREQNICTDCFKDVPELAAVCQLNNQEVKKP